MAISNAITVLSLTATMYKWVRGPDKAASSCQHCHLDKCRVWGHLLDDETDQDIDFGTLGQAFIYLFVEFLLARDRIGTVHETLSDAAGRSRCFGQDSESMFETVQAMALLQQRDNVVFSM
ncbi:hypothetical protein DPSP01_009215 [Paraphaeosphaeria sporulosa]